MAFRSYTKLIQAVVMKLARDKLSFGDLDVINEVMEKIHAFRTLSNTREDQRLQVKGAQICGEMERPQGAPMKSSMCEDFSRSLEETRAMLCLTQL